MAVMNRREMLGLTAVGIVGTLTAVALPAQAQDSDYLKRFEELVFVGVNKERTKGGLKPLTRNSHMDGTARTWSAGLDNDFKHNPDFGGQIPGGWSLAAENIIGGSDEGSVEKNAADFVQRWMDSEGHRANIMNPDLTHTGIGVVKSGETYWGTQVFGAYESSPEGSYEQSAPAKQQQEQKPKPEPTQAEQPTAEQTQSDQPTAEQTQPEVTAEKSASPAPTSEQPTSEEPTPAEETVTQKDAVTEQGAERPDEAEIRFFTFRWFWKFILGA